VWKKLVEKQAEVFGVRGVETFPPETEAAPSTGDAPKVIVSPPTSIPALVTQLLMFGGTLENVPGRKASRRPSSAATTSNQLGLFQSQG
jgi:hypothetical protein